MLTIAIPTYNRADKVKRLLSFIKDEILFNRLKKEVAVIVSDNASTDKKTHLAVSEFLDCGLNLKYYKQPENVGLDGNCRFLYMHATTKYVWFMADDDLPLKGAIGKIIETLETYSPDILLFSFIQPPGSTVRQFDYPEPVHLVKDPIVAIEHVLRYTKLSIFVYRKVQLNDFQWRSLDENLGYGWYYISLAFSVLDASPNLQLAAISEPLATCDEDYFVIAYTPEPLLCMERMIQHPFVMKYNPALLEFYQCEGYYQAIQFAFAAKVGSLVAESPEDYDKFISDLKFRIPILLKRPRSLFQFLALKLHFVWLWPRIRPTVRHFTSYFANQRKNDEYSN